MKASISLQGMTPRPGMTSLAAMGLRIADDFGEQVHVRAAAHRVASIDVQAWFALRRVAPPAAAAASRYRWAATLRAPIRGVGMYDAAAVIRVTFPVAEAGAVWGALRSVAEAAVQEQKQ